MSKKELLSLEREMLGLYISGHPLENYKETIAEQTNINTFTRKQLRFLRLIKEGKKR